MATVIADNFDFRKTQPYFVYFVKLNALSVGDTWQANDFQTWINGKHLEFQNAVGSRWKNIVAASSSKNYQREFIDWLKGMS